MPVTKLGISIPEELLEEIDKISQGLKKNRSEVIREAITKMINDYKKQQAVGKAGNIYRELAEDDKRLAEEFFGICEKPAKYKAGIKAKRK